MSEVQHVLGEREFRMSSQSVLILHNHPLLPDDHPESASEHTIVEIADSMTAMLQDAGFRVRRLGLEQDPTALWTELHRRRPNAVFNLFLCGARSRARTNLFPRPANELFAVLADQL